MYDDESIDIGPNDHVILRPGSASSTRIRSVRFLQVNNNNKKNISPK